VSEVVYLGVAAAYFWLWRTDRLLDYRIQKKAAMPEPALIKVRRAGRRAAGGRGCCDCDACMRPNHVIHIKL